MLPRPSASAPPRRIRPTEAVFGRSFRRKSAGRVPKKYTFGAETGRNCLMCRGFQGTQERGALGKTQRIAQESRLRTARLIRQLGFCGGFALTLRLRRWLRRCVVLRWSRLSRCSLGSHSRAVFGRHIHHFRWEERQAKCSAIMRASRMRDKASATRPAPSCATLTWRKHAGEIGCLWLPDRRLARTWTQTLAPHCYSVPVRHSGSSPVVPATFLLLSSTLSVFSLHLRQTWANMRDVSRGHRTRSVL